MSILTVLQWLADTRWSVALHESVYVWPLLESVHVLCLALFVGTAVMLDLRLLGVAMTHIPASAFTQRLLPWTRGAFVVMVVTGVLLFTATPVTYYNSLSFRIKLILLAAAGFNVWFFHARTRRRIADWDSAVMPPTAARVAAIVSLAAWTGVVIAGRLVAYEESPTRLLARISPWIFPAIESAHLLGLCALGGTLLIVDLRMLGLGLTNQPLADARHGGAPMARGEPRADRLDRAPALRVGGREGSAHAVVLGEDHHPARGHPLHVHSAADASRRSRPDTSRRTRVTAAVSLLLWFTVASAGRWIGFSS